MANNFEILNIGDFITNHDGVAFMKTIYSLISQGAPIRCNALGRYGFWVGKRFSDFHECITLHTEPNCKGKSIGVTSFSSGDRVRLINIENELIIENILEAS